MASHSCHMLLLDEVHVERPKAQTAEEFAGLLPRDIDSDDIRPLPARLAGENRADTLHILTLEACSGGKVLIVA